MAYHHSRTPSSTSDIHLTDTVSFLHRCVFGNMFRSQRQFARFFFCVAGVMLFLYVIGPWDSLGRKHQSSASKTKFVSTPPADKPDIPQTESEYRAKFFEEIGRRMDKKQTDIPHQENRPPSNSEKSKESSSGVNLQEIAEKVKRAAENLSRCKEVPGISVAIVKGEKSVLLPLGLADVKTKRSMTSDTHFLLNSISKTFIGQLLAILINEAPRNITWDTPVITILGPDFHLATDELTQKVTLRDLLSHRTGLSSGNLAVRATYPAGWTKADLVRQLHHLPPSVPFRKSFLYSNMMGMLAAHVAEKLGGAPWEKLIVDKLLVPLGMEDSRPLKSHTELTGVDFARPYVPVDGRLTECDTKIFDQGPLSAVALLTSTAADMAKWIRFNLRQGRLENGKQLIPRETWSTMWSQQAELSPMFLQAVDKSSNQWPVHDVSQGYGLVWFINKYRGLKNFWHGGGLYTHYALTWTFPESQAGLYITINGYSGDSRPFSIIESLAYYTADLLLGYQPWLDQNSVCQYPDFWLADTKVSHRNHSSSKNDSKDTSGADAGQNAVSSRGDSVVQGKDAKKKPISSLVTDNSDLPDVAKEKFQAVADSYARLTTMSAPHKLDEPSSDFLIRLGKPVPSGSRAVLSRRAREARNPSAVEKFDIRQDQNASSGKEAVLVAARNTQDIINSEKPFKIAVPVRQPSELPRQPPRKVYPVYDGDYSHPLIGNLTVFTNKTSGQLQCRLNLLTAILVPVKDHIFGVELTGSLRFLSKPSAKSPAKQVYKVEFVEEVGKGVVALDFHSNWSMEVPLRFSKIR